MTSPRISVLIPAFDVAPVVARAIRSSLAQADGTLIVEVIVVDDASADATAETVEAIARDDDRVHLIRLEANGGPGVARAAGLLAARGDWIAVLDADDEMAPGRLGRLIAIARDRCLDMIADNLVLCDPQEGPVGTAFPLAPGARVPLSPERVLRNAVPGGRVNLGWMQPLVRRDFLARHEITWRPIRHGEDMLFMLEVLLAGARAALAGEAGYVYTQRRGRLSGAASEHSRTRRSAEEQIRAIEILERVGATTMSATLKRRLAQMRPEIRVTTRVLDGLDHLRERRIAAAVRAFAAALGSPAALGRCITSRFGPRSRKVI